MWIELEVLLKEKLVNWQELGFDIPNDFARRMLKAEEIYFLQEVTHDIQILALNDGTSIYVKGSYEMLRDNILHLTSEEDLDL